MSCQCPLLNGYRCPNAASFFLAASSTLAPEPTIERLARIGHAPAINKPEYYESRPFAPRYDLSETAAALGWTPEYDLRPLFFPGER